MKQSLLLFSAALLPALSFAQGKPASGINMEVVHIVSILFIFGLIMAFIVLLVKRVLDYQLKKKMIDRGVTDEVAAALLQKDSQSEKQLSLKWFFLFAGTALGLVGTHYTQPLGMHSLAILCAGIALGYLCFYLYSPWKQK